MWDAHHCVSAARRAADMAPRLNDVVRQLRADGALIIHAPADCADFYAGTPARERAQRAPHADAPVEFGWNTWHADELAALPESLTAPESCSCDTPEPCCDARPVRPWIRHMASIDVDASDAVSDDGQEIFNLLTQFDITDVAVVGVHTNICVLSRWYGIRQLVYLGKRPVLCRDLTDSFHRDPRGHQWGTDAVIAHIERRWCPAVSSADLVAGRWPRH